MSENKTDDKATPPPKPMTDTDYIREIERLKAEVQKRTDQTRQMYGVTTEALAWKAVNEEQQRQTHIEDIVLDTNSTTHPYTKEELANKTLEELRLIKTTADRVSPTSFANIAAHQAEQDRKKAPLLTVGKWDYRKEEWIGGT